MLTVQTYLDLGLQLLLQLASFLDDRIPLVVFPFLGEISPGMAQDRSGLVAALNCDDLMLDRDLPRPYDDDCVGVQNADDGGVGGVGQEQLVRMRAWRRSHGVLLPVRVDY